MAWRFTRKRLALAFGLLCFLSAGAQGFASTVPGLSGAAADQGPDLTGSPSVPAQATIPKDGISTARLALGSGGRELRLDGDLTDGIADRVATLLAANPGVVLLRLGSDGGLVEEGEALARVVTAYGLSTYVTRLCASACTLAYVRGHRRYLGPYGRLGFHGPYVAGFLGEARRADATSERNAYIRAGLGSEFVARALAVAPESMWFPTAGRLRTSGVVTDLARPDDVPAAPGPKVARGSPSAGLASAGARRVMVSEKGR